jgi:mannose-1-phosphate guanylyltransferase
MTEPTKALYGVVLAGGTGTRLWPLSRAGHPKFLHQLTGTDASLLQATVDRLDALTPADRVFVVTGVAHAAAVSRQLTGVPEENVLVEPSPRDSCAAIALAAAVIARRDPEAVMGSFASDHLVADTGRFIEVIRRAMTGAEQGLLMTLGITPTRPETGYGYLVPGAPLDENARTVARFSEKPDAATALDLMAAGALWNSGLFAWTARRLLEEVDRHTPEVAPALPALYAGDVAMFFRKVTPISIDVGLLERSDAVAVVSGAFAWDDVGTWQALARVRPKDPSGNVVVGPAVLHETHDSVVWSDGAPVVLFGVQDLVVVSANGRILVMPTERAASMKQLLDALPAQVRDVGGSAG